jgi:hypothetical protein
MSCDQRIVEPETFKRWTHMGYSLVRRRSEKGMGTAGELLKQKKFLNGRATSFDERRDQAPRRSRIPTLSEPERRGAWPSPFVMTSRHEAQSDKACNRSQYL